MGLIHVYCGDGKGKTSAACGLAVRMAGRGNSVVIARFLKTDDSGEVEMLKLLPGVEVIPCEKEFGFVFAMDAETKREAAEFNTQLFRSTVERAINTSRACGSDNFCEKVSNQEGRAPGVQCLLVLDEIMAAMNLGMVPESEVLEFLKHRPENLEVVLTGRDPSAEILAMADYISEINKIRHPFEKGISARIGIEY